MVEKLSLRFFKDGLVTEVMSQTFKGVLFSSDFSTLPYLGAAFLSVRGWYYQKPRWPPEHGILKFFGKFCKKAYFGLKIIKNKEKKIGHVFAYHALAAILS